MKLSELLENILDMDRHIKAHLNTLFHSKTGDFIRGEEYSKSFDEAVITRLDEAKKRVNSELKYLNPFAPGVFAEKRVLKLVEWFSGHCRAIKS